MTSKVPIIRMDAINEKSPENEFEEEKKEENTNSMNLNMMEMDDNVKENTTPNKAGINKQSSLSDLMSQNQSL